MHFGVTDGTLKTLQNNNYKIDINDSAFTKTSHSKDVWKISGSHGGDYEEWRLL
jgi:hypothetical protein